MEVAGIVDDEDIVDESAEVGAGERGDGDAAGDMEAGGDKGVETEADLILGEALDAGVVVVEEDPVRVSEDALACCCCWDLFRWWR